MLISSLAFASAWLAVEPPAARRLHRLEPRAEARVVRAWRVAPAASVGLGLGLVGFILLGPTGLGWAAAAGIAGGTIAWLVLERVHHRRARARADEVAQAARLLSSLLRSGQIPTEALREAADDYPILAPAAAASRLGIDVTGALRAGAAQPGAGGMATIAAAWQVSAASGAPVASVLQRVAEALRSERRVAQVVETELAAARASGHIMAVLPFAAVGLGVFAGVNPLEFLLGAALGQILSLVAVTLTAVGVVWIERLARR